MRKLILAGAAILSLSAAIPAYAQDTDAAAGAGAAVGATSGATLGFIFGGPVGAIIGGFSGAIIGGTVSEDEGLASAKHTFLPPGAAV